jgi:hypothetical protein
LWPNFLSHRFSQIKHRWEALEDDDKGSQVEVSCPGSGRCEVGLVPTGINVEEAKTGKSETGKMGLAKAGDFASMSELRMRA